MLYISRPVTVSVVSHLQQHLIKMLLDDLQIHSNQYITVILTINVDEIISFDTNKYSFPIKVISNKTAKGFGENQNQAFNYCDTTYFCVVNPDIRLREEPFKKLIAELEEQSAGLIAPKVVNPEGVVEDSIRNFPTPLSIIKKILFKKRSADYPTNQVILNPDWVGGMFMLFKADVFKQVGGFDERYFMYYEDVDVCRMLHQIGYKIVYSPNCTVVHDARRSSHKDLKYLSWHLSSMLRFFVKWLFK